MFGPARAASTSSPSWQVSSLAAWQSTWLHWCQVCWAPAGSLLFGPLPEYIPLPYIEPSIPESPAVFLGLPCVMTAHGGRVLCPHPYPQPQGEQASSEFWPCFSQLWWLLGALDAWFNTDTLLTTAPD